MGIYSTFQRQGDKNNTLSGLPAMSARRAGWCSTGYAHSLLVSTESVNTVEVVMSIDMPLKQAYKQNAMIHGNYAMNS
jgi:hypothetical protein